MSAAYPSITGTAAAGSGGLSTTDTVSNIPGPPPPPPPPPPPAALPLEDIAKEEPEDDSHSESYESDGSSEVIMDGHVRVKYKDYQRREGNSSQTRLEHEQVQSPTETAEENHLEHQP